MFFQADTIEEVKETVESDIYYTDGVVSLNNPSWDLAYNGSEGRYEGDHELMFYVIVGPKEACHPTFQLCIPMAMKYHCDLVVLFDSNDIEL